MPLPLQAEAAAKQKAKDDLKAFLLSNDLNQKIKDEKRQREFQDDIRWIGQEAVAYQLHLLYMPDPALALHAQPQPCGQYE